MITLRLQRKGRKKRPFYHIVAADSRSPRDGRVIERLGRFDNVSEKKELTLDEERIIHWLKVGAQPSDTVRSILKKEGIMYKMHLLRWGKTEEEIEQALTEWREQRSEAAVDAEKETSRKERQKKLLEAEEKEYKEQLEKKAAEAARKAKIAKAEAEQAEAEQAEAEEAAAGKEEAQPDEKKTETAEVEEAAAADSGTEAIDTEEKEAEKKAETGQAEAEKTEAKKADETEVKEKAEVEKEAKAKEKPETVSTDMNANNAIDHIKNTPLEELEGFVPEDEERVTVQRAWESKQSE